MKRNKLHKHLIKVCPGWDEYRNGYCAYVNTGNPDCSCGCVFFATLQAIGDWGVCANEKSPRAGQLTWEHMGCKQFQKGKINDR